MRTHGIRAAGLGARAAFAAGLLLVTAAASAASFTLRSDVDARTIGMEDQLQLTITLLGSGGPGEVALPALTNLELVNGPFQSTQVSIVNGQMTQSRSYTYVLRPLAVGSAEIGAVTAGQETAPPIAIQVVAGSVRPRQRERRPDPFGDPLEELFNRRRGRAVEPKLLVEASPSRTKLHVGEPLVLTYYLYTQSPVAEMHFKEAPRYAGFWAEDLERPQAPESGDAATVGGVAYRRFPVLRKLLFPTKAGALTLPAATFRVGLASQDFFDAAGVVERSTQPLTVTVEPLPDIPGFSGAVGRLRATASLDRDQVPLGEAATLRFRLEGMGNLKWIERGPDVKLAGAKVYPPQAKTDVKATAEGISGSRTWEFVVVPQTSGSVAIPELAFSYFDPQAGKVVTARTEPLSLRVSGGIVANGLPSAASPTLAGPNASSLPLRSDLDRPQALPLRARSFALLVALALLGHAGLWAGGRLHGAVRRGEGRKASPRAVRAAVRELSRVGTEAMSKEKAAALVEKALIEAFGEIPDVDGDERARAVRALLDEAHFVRYAPQLGQYGEKLRDLAARAQEAVRRWA